MSTQSHVMDTLPPALNPGLARLTIPGDYTIVYTFRRKDLSTPEQRKELRAEIYKTLQDAIFSNVMHRQRKSDEAVPPEIEAKAAALADREADLNTAPMTLTLSQSGDKFLYRLMTKQADPTVSMMSDGLLSSVMLYDGSKSFFSNYGDHLAMLFNGFDGADLEFMPILSTHIGNIPLFKDVHPVGNNDFEGNVFVAASNDGSRCIYGNTRLHVETIDGLPRVTKFVNLLSDNTVGTSTEATTFVRFKGIWIPSQIITTVYSEQLIWSLTSTSPTAVDLGLFDFHTYMHPGYVIQDNTNPKGSQIIHYTPGMSLNFQKP